MCTTYNNFLGKSELPTLWQQFDGEKGAVGARGTPNGRETAKEEKDIRTKTEKEVL